MNKVGGRATQTVSRFVFANTNETDGTCGLDELLMTDGVTEPDATAGQAKLFVDSDGGDLKVVFADGQVKTIVTDEP